MLDRWNISRAKALYEEIVDGAGGLEWEADYIFQFQYIPRYGKTTFQGEERSGRGCLHEKYLERTISGWLTFFFALIGVTISVANVRSIRLAVAAGSHSLSQK